MNTKQKLAIAGVIVAGVLLGSVIMTAERGKGASAESSQADAGSMRGDADRSDGTAPSKARSDEDSHGYGRKEPAQTARGNTGAPSQAGERAGAQAGAADSGKAGIPDTLALSDEQIRASGIALDEAGPAQLSGTLTLPGEIRFNEDRTAHVVPRVAGVIEAVHADLGQQVRRGQVLAVIASTTVSEQRSELAAATRRLEFARTTYEREKKLWEEKISAQQDYQQAQAALQEADIAVANARQKLAAVGVTPSPAAGNRFELRAPFDGMVLEKHVVLGEAVTDSTNIFTISDLSTVWANFNVPANDLQAVRVGERAVVRAPALGAEVAGTVSYVGSLIGEATRTATARVTIKNPQGAWRPGLFVNVSLAAGERRAPVTVASDAIQTVDGKPQVFVRVPGGFAPRAVEVGASHSGRTEITRGLEPGTQVAAAGSFVLKSELEKGSADHAH